MRIDARYHHKPIRLMVFKSFPYGSKNDLFIGFHFSYGQ
jgi:hypothetical protein